MTIRLRDAALGALALFLSASAANAAVVGFGLTVATAGASGDQPRFTLTNLSDAETLDSFSFAINAPGFWFDYVYSQTVVTGALTRSLTTGQTVANENSGTTSVAYSFGGFDPGEAFSFRTDLDAIGVTDSATNFRTVFFNNGAGVPNASAMATFSDGRTLAVTLTGSPNQSSYIFTAQIDDAADVPVPAAAPLAVAGLAALGFVARRRKG